MPKIEPRTLKGFRDFLPERQIVRQKMIEKIKASFETFGFEPLETPALEYADVLTGKYGEEGDKLMYRFRDNGERDVALRYDLTIPLARVVAQYDNEIKKPWKRYQISPVWRAENTQKGRFREFYQCDADIVGSKSSIADAEILALANFILRKLGIGGAVIRVNSREIIFDFFTNLGLTEEKQIAAMRVIDKREKIGDKAVAEGLIKLGLNEKNTQTIVEFSSIKIENFENTNEIKKITEKFPEIKVSLQKLQNIMSDSIKLLPVDLSTKLIIDFSIARGLDYYTGIIFETNIWDKREYSPLGSILSGGRYDNLISMFSNQSIPAVGLSIGLDRLIAFFEEVNSIKVKTLLEVLVINFDETLIDEYLRITSDLRNANRNTMLYFEPADLKKQLSYASDRGIPYALIYGPNEAKKGVMIIKDLKKGTQIEVKKTDVVKYFVK